MVDPQAVTNNHIIHSRMAKDKAAMVDKGAVVVMEVDLVEVTAARDNMMVRVMRPHIRQVDGHDNGKKGIGMILGEIF